MSGRFAARQVLINAVCEHWARDAQRNWSTDDFLALAAQGFRGYCAYTNSELVRYAQLHGLDSDPKVADAIERLHQP